jgi:DMSO/TMAO reductase YedYZ molybdopterin-dependent catalytic subunit
MKSLDQARSGLVMVQAEPYNAEAPPEALASEITPVGRHYVRSNFALPEHDGVLKIDGAVREVRSITLDDLRAMPKTERAVTLECAGNGRLGQFPLPAGEPWGGFAVSTARWGGALLHEVLRQAGPATDAVEVVCHAADRGPYYTFDDLAYARSLKVAHAMDLSAEILIAYEMNGEPLNADHGAPFRLIVPNWYGVASVKWLKRMELVTRPFQGEFQTGHYMYEWADQPHEPVTLLRVRARITDPAPGIEIPLRPYRIRGKAWTGTGPITRVELSFTGEGEWFPADVMPADSPYQWQDWYFDWTPPKTGRHSLRARATDAAGNIQPLIPPWNRLGYGNNAVEVQYVQVV